MSVEALAVVLHHSRSSGTAKVVLLGIANHAGDGGSWPSIATLAQYGNCSERNVQRVVAELQAMGEVSVEANAGGTQHTDPRYRTNRYEVLVQCPEGCDRTVNHRVSERVSGVTPTAPLPEPEGLRGDIPGSQGVTSTVVRGEADVTRTVLEPSMEPSTTDVVLANLIAPDVATEMFNCFWDVYPRHTGGRPTARKAWDRAIRTTDPQRIVDGALRFREDPNRLDEFTPHPSTWLNQSRWDDDPLPARLSVAATRTSGTATYLDVAGSGSPGEAVVQGKPLFELDWEAG